MNLLINESISLQTESYINDKFYIDKIKESSPNRDINLIQQELLHYENNKIGRFLEIASYYPNNFRSFFLTQIYGFIESELSLICKEHAQKQVKDFRIENKSILKNLEKYIKYYWSNFDIKITEEFKFFDRVRLIRNYIVHSSGIVSANEKARIEQIWKTGQDLFEFKEIGEGEFQIYITGDKLILDFLNSGESLFKKIVDVNFSNGL